MRLCAFQEKKTMNKNVKKIICGALAAVSVFGCAATLTACETSHPQMEMQIEFAGETYVLSYELARNVTPATVNHFIWLVDNGYYNGLCVHDYDEDSKMFAGAYKAATEATDADGLTYVSYYSEIAKYENYSSFPYSVWLDSEKKTPTYTLYGEFEANNVQVQNGKIYDKFGSLSMFYYNSEKYEASKADVWGAREADSEKVYKRTYEQNSATSIFSMNLKEDANSYNKNYCTFATLSEDSVEVLKDLVEAIDNQDDFVEAHSVRVLEDDAVLGEYEISESFNVPQKQIKIKSMKITKY